MRDFPGLLKVCEELSRPRQRAQERGKLAKSARLVNVPETVVLEKGKPQRMYFLDSNGDLRMKPMKASAELLRVLRDLVKLRERREKQAQRDDSSPSRTGYPCRPTKDHTWRAELLGSTSNVPMEVAMLYYDDGAVRPMTDTEARAQMRGRSKLPREFWQHVRMLQSFVPSSRRSSRMRFITYNFDVRAMDEKAALRLGHGVARKAAIQMGMDTLERVDLEEVPRPLTASRFCTEHP